jgi:alanyl-tRNA synthetase
MEYELKTDGTLTPLPQQNVDTGMGVERLAAIVQEVPSRSVYETDGYQAIMAWIEKESGVAWDADEVATKAHRVLADHGRGMTCLVADGVVPSNEGRGYVLRHHPPCCPAGAEDRARTCGDSLTSSSADGPVVSGARGRPGPIREALRAEEERFSETLARMKLSAGRAGRTLSARMHSRSRTASRSS